MESTEIILGLVIGIPLAIWLILRGYNPVTERIAPRIVIEASPDSFVFEFRGSRVQIEPLIYVKTDNKALVVAVGQDLPNDPSVMRIDLFECNSQPEQGIDRAEVLEAFLRFGILEVMEHSFFYSIIRVAVLRPIIVFRGLEKFSPLLCGYQRQVFDTLLKEQIVMTVLYE